VKSFSSTDCRSPGNPYDGHTLARIIPAIEQLIGNTVERLHADAGYRGHNAPREYTAKQSKGVASPHKSTARAARFRCRAGHRSPA
jgi:hypothetical protein